MKSSNTPYDFLADIVSRNKYLKELAEKAISQISDEAFFASPNEHTNSIAILVKHLAGNLNSRWRDPLTTDGEKPDRDRDSEFYLTSNDTKASLLERWENGFSLLFNELERMSDRDLDIQIRIRGQQQSVRQAITRQLAHAAFHVGQIVFLAKLQAGDDWKTLSIAMGESQEFNKDMGYFFDEE